MYKEASKQKLRFETSMGLVSTEQLWDLPIGVLDDLAVKLDDQYKSSKGKSFVEKKTEKDKTIKLRFDIVLDVLNTKLDESEKARTALEDKEHNQKILSLIKNKQDESLNSMSIKELEDQLR